MEMQDNGYEAIGKFVVNFSKLTYALGLCIQKLIEKDNKLIIFINRDEKIKRFLSKGLLISQKEIKELSEILRHILSAWEINKILKSLLLEKYSYDLEFLKVLDHLFAQIDEFCEHRNDFMHSWILIDDKSPWKIMINRSVLINWKLIEKKIELNLDKLNDELSVVATHIYAISRILHQNGKIENYLITQNGKPIFLDTVKPFISKKGKI